MDKKDEPTKRRYKFDLCVWSFEVRSSKLEGEKEFVSVRLFVCLSVCLFVCSFGYKTFVALFCFRQDDNDDQDEIRTKFPLSICDFRLFVCRHTNTNKRHNKILVKIRVAVANETRSSQLATSFAPFGFVLMPNSDAKSAISISRLQKGDCKSIMMAAPISRPP